jgi:NADPH2:quinone reductase
MATAIVLRETGGPEVLKGEGVAVGRPGPGEMHIRQTAIGVNFHDVYVRSGLYRTLPLPGIPGIEAAGVIEELGAGVSGFEVGDRIAYVTGQYGAYASERILPAALAIRLPPDVSEQVAATILLKGLTAEMLVREVHPVRPGDVVLVHAAAGGVGQLLCQLARHLGATVIGTVGSEAKARLARRVGCAHTILYRQEDFIARVREITDGQGVNVAYDSVGKDTFEGSLESLAVRGHLVNFGQSSGSVAPFEVSRLAARSNSVTRPILFHYTARRADLERMAAALFDDIGRGVLAVPPGKAFPLTEASAAHAELEARQAPGPLLLTP